MEGKGRRPKESRPANGRGRSPHLRRAAEVQRPPEPDAHAAPHLSPEREWSWPRRGQSRAPNGTGGGSGGVPRRKWRPGQSSPAPRREGQGRAEAEAEAEASSPAREWKGRGECLLRRAGSPAPGMERPPRAHPGPPPHGPGSDGLSPGRSMMTFGVWSGGFGTFPGVFDAPDAGRPASGVWSDLGPDLPAFARHSDSGSKCLWPFWGRAQPGAVDEAARPVRRSIGSSTTRATSSFVFRLHPAPTRGSTSPQDSTPTSPLSVSRSP